MQNEGTGVGTERRKGVGVTIGGVEFSTGGLEERWMLYGFAPFFIFLFVFVFFFSSYPRARFWKGTVA